MPVKTIFLIIGLIFSSSSVQADSETHSKKTAKERVDAYLALRRACSITEGESRQECFKLLNAATADYKTAKRELAMQQPIPDSPDNEDVTLISQTQ